MTPYHFFENFVTRGIFTHEDYVIINEAIDRLKTRGDSQGLRDSKTNRSIRANSAIR